MIKYSLLNFIICSVVVSTALAANPTTKPVAKPAATIVVENAAYHFRYAVPKAWTAKQKSDKTTVYELPGSAGVSSGGIFVVLTGTPVKDGAKLDDIVAGKKHTLVERSDKTKFTADKVVTLDGEPAWRLEYQYPRTAKQTTSVNGKPADVKEVDMASQAVEVMCVRGKVVVDLMYVTVAENFAAHSKQVEDALASFQWTDKK